MTVGATVRDNEARQSMRGAAQAFARQHSNPTAYQTRGLTLDVRWCARKYVCRVVHEDENFEAIDRFKGHARLLKQVSRSFHWRMVYFSWLLHPSDVRFAPESRQTEGR